MPWCDECSRYWTPTSLKAGACPTCGRSLASAGGTAEAPKVPWHFTLLLIALAVYLGYRFIQLGAWVLHKL